jgi:regulator of sigma E protease
MHLLNILLAMGPNLVRGLQLFAALSILIILHEWGHYYAARKTGTRVEKFYLFFDFFFPFSTLLPFSIFKIKKGDTEYGMGWFPLGGYVKIAGMVDESMDKEALAKPPQPWEFRSKTAPQRLLIMLGGIIMNVILAIVVYVFIFAKWGETKLPNKNLTYGIACDSLALEAGFKDGDKIVSINGKDVPYFDDVLKTFVLKGAKTVVVDRNGTNTEIAIPDGIIGKMVNKKKGLFDPRVPFIVDTTSKECRLITGEVKKGDRLISIDGKPVTYSIDFKNQARAFLAKLPDTKAATLEANPIAGQFLRNEKDTVNFTAVLGAKGTLGVQLSMDMDKLFKAEVKKYSILEAIPKSLSYSWEKLGDYTDNLTALFKSKEIKVSESLGGFGSFAKLFPTTFSWESFLRLLAFISIMLAFMNLLPIPGLDGGYVLFLLVEIITGKKVSDAFMEKATGVGLILLVTLMLYANGLDIFRAWFQ